MGCIDEYSKTCLKPRDRKILENHVAGARYTFRFLCDDAGFQSGKSDCCCYYYYYYYYYDKGRVTPVPKWYAMKTYLFLNKAPRHEDILVKWRYSSTHS
jgi:hypothetical protein